MLRALRPGRLGALAERDYRLLFTATLLTSLGDGITLVALAFAVLDVGNARDLGIVIAVREVASVALILTGGVVSDRLPRNRILVVAALVQAVAQAATAATVLSHTASVTSFALLGVLWGVGDGFVVPAEVGLVPQTISAARLQQANALQGLSRNGVRVLGPAIGGVLVVVLNPGWALAVDSLTFLACAALMARIHLTPRAAVVEERFLQALRSGWREFRSRTWLWTTTLFFGLVNLLHMFWQVLGPAVAKHQLGGAGAWAAILTAGGLGTIVGGLVAMRYRPRQSLVASIGWGVLSTPKFAALALGAPTSVTTLASFVGGIGLAMHLTLWFTVFQREVPDHARSRVASYDALGSFALAPAGAAIAGPIALAIGTSGALWLAAGGILAAVLVMLAIPAVWRVQQRSPEEVATAAG